MIVFYNENFRKFDTIREMATVVLTDKMLEESAISMNQYVDGWIETMNEISSESIEEGEIFTPYNKNSIISIIVDKLTSEVATLKNNVRGLNDYTICLGIHPTGLYEEIEEQINRCLGLEINRV
tara:strand:+ start:877 stop:1248 length:372 start_codon:yes stop_codon:yes gene_type:complete